MENPFSPLDTLRQLKEMLDAGALTPSEFEALKQRLVFGELAPTPVAAAPVAPAPAPFVVLPPAPAAEQHSPTFEDVAAEPPMPIVPGGPPVAGAELPLGQFSAQPALLPALVSNWPTEFPEAAADVPTARRSSPLALILSIGAVLGFLALVLYLTLNRPPSEHISSTSQTAADSLTTAVETGPQAAPLPLAAPAAPETVRVAPAHPAPATPVRVRPTPTMRDSVYGAPAPAAPDSAAHQ